MCDICNKARKLPKLDALKLVAQAMQQRKAPECLDGLVGELINMPWPVTDREADQAWEKRRRGK